MVPEINIKSIKKRLRFWSLSKTIFSEFELQTGLPRLCRRPDVWPTLNYQPCSPSGFFRKNRALAAEPVVFSIWRKKPLGISFAYGSEGTRQKRPSSRAGAGLEEAAARFNPSGTRAAASKCARA